MPARSRRPTPEFMSAIPACHRPSSAASPTAARSRRAPAMASASVQRTRPSPAASAIRARSRRIGIDLRAARNSAVRLLRRHHQFRHDLGGRLRHPCRPFDLLRRHHQQRHDLGGQSRHHIGGTSAASASARFSGGITNSGTISAGAGASARRSVAFGISRHQHLHRQYLNSGTITASDRHQHRRQHHYRRNLRQRHHRGDARHHDRQCERDCRKQHRDLGFRPDLYRRHHQCRHDLGGQPPSGIVGRPLQRNAGACVTISTFGGGISNSGTISAANGTTASSSAVPRIPAHSLTISTFSRRHYQFRHDHRGPKRHPGRRLSAPAPSRSPPSPAASAIPARSAAGTRHAGRRQRRAMPAPVTISTFSGGISNSGTDHRRRPVTASGRRPGAGVGGTITIATFADGIKNSGTICGRRHRHRRRRHRHRRRCGHDLDLRRRHHQCTGSIFGAASVARSDRQQRNIGVPSRLSRAASAMPALISGRRLRYRRQWRLDFCRRHPKLRHDFGGGQRHRCAVTCGHLQPTASVNTAGGTISGGGFRFRHRRSAAQRRRRCLYGLELLRRYQQCRHDLGGIARRVF